MVNAKKNKQIEQKNEMKWKKNETPVQTRLGFSSKNLQEHVRKPASKDGLEKTK